MRRKILKRLKFLHQTVYYANRISPVFSRGFFRSWKQGAKLCRKYRFTPKEAFRLGCFHPEFRDSEVFVSRVDMTRRQEQFNPPSFAPWLKNKVLFYQYCHALNIGTPTVYAYGGSRSGAWINARGQSLRSLDDKRHLLTHELPEQFLLKPLTGAYGAGIERFTRKNGLLKDSRGNERDYDVLISELDSGGEFLLQQVLENHPSLLGLTGCRGLQALRVITHVDEAGQTQLLHCHLKVISRADIITDTCIEGLNGNIEVPVDMATGRLQSGNRITGSGQGIVEVPRHPLTGLPFEGFPIPHWETMKEWIRKIAGDFLPIRTVGWDVALTPDGPRLLEGNIWYDPPNQHRRMAEIMRAYLPSWERRMTSE